MPHFFLHVHDGFTAIDREGVELVDLEAARKEAIAGLRDIVAQQVKLGQLPRYEHIVIADDMGLRLATVTFDDAITTLEKKDA
jgi:hypothetical protein